MKTKFLTTIMLAAALATSVADAKGGFSSGGGRSGSSVSSGRSYSSAPAAPPRQTVTPTPSVNPNKGGFNSATPQSSPNRQAAVAPQTQTQRQVTTSTTTTSRSYSNQVGGGVMFGGFGMGYGYTNGLLTGMIIGNMMHPHGTVMYTGHGSYSNNALLYPNGQVVDQSGRVVGTYVGGVFTPVSNGQVVAKAVPADAYATAPVQQAQPVIIQKQTDYAAIVLATLCFFMVIILFIIIL